MVLGLDDDDVYRGDVVVGDNAEPFSEYRERFAAEETWPSRVAERPDRDPAVTAAVLGSYVGLLAVFKIGVAALGFGLVLLVFHGGVWAEAFTGIGVVTCLYGVHRYLVYRRMFAAYGHVPGTEAGDDEEREERG